MNQLYFIRALLQVKNKSTVLVKVDSRYAGYFTEYSSYFGQALRSLKFMYVMTNSGKIFAGDLTEWSLEAG